MTMFNSDQINNDADLCWTAFQYVADELRPDDAAAFERRLETDQIAREAVARVVELSQTVRALPIETFATPTAPAVAPIFVASRSNTTCSLPVGWSHPVGWMAVGMAACLMAMMGIQAVGPGLAPATDVLIASSAPADKASHSDAVALAWFRTQGAVDVDGLAANGLVAEEHDASLAELSEEVIEETDGEFIADANTNNARTPAWLLAALSATPQPSVTGDN
jgi:anti-sigma factor RsiW